MQPITQTQKTHTFFSFFFSRACAYAADEIGTCFFFETPRKKLCSVSIMMMIFAAAFSAGRRTRTELREIPHSPLSFAYIYGTQ